MSKLVKVGAVGAMALVVFFLILPSEVKCNPQEQIDQDHALSLLGDYSGEEFKTLQGKKAVSKAIEYVESFGITPYDFARDLNYQGKSDKAIFWCEALAIATNDPAYFYGRAYYRWASGDSESAIRDVNFLVQKKSLSNYSGAYLLLARANEFTKPCAR